MGVGSLIFVIVDKYKEEIVLEKALAAGAESGVIFKGRGTVDEDQIKFLGIQIQPEKRVVILVTKADVTQKILEELTETLKLEGINNGIAFSVPIKRAIGSEGLRGDTWDNG